MTISTDRLDIRLSAEDKDYIRLAAEAVGAPVASFVREAAMSYAVEVLGKPVHSEKKKPARDDRPLSERMRGKATWARRMRGTAGPGLTTDEIMKLMRDYGK